MALKVVSMHELKLEVLLEPARTGETVAEVCLRRGISRASYYRYRRRLLEEGAEGLGPRSRRPRSAPGQLETSLEVEICTLRRKHPRWGARRIRAELRRAGISPPATSTIHQVLRRNHLVSPRPRRRAKADKRFEREVPNDLWQIERHRGPTRLGRESLGRRLPRRPRPLLPVRPGLRRPERGCGLALLYQCCSRLRAPAPAPLR